MRNYVYYTHTEKKFGIKELLYCAHCSFQRALGPELRSVRMFIMAQMYMRLVEYCLSYQTTMYQVILCIINIICIKSKYETIITNLYMECALGSSSKSFVLICSKWTQRVYVPTPENANYF